MRALTKVKYVALTADCWTSLSNDGYMTVTVHYLGEQFKMVSRVLNTITFSERHTAKNLAKELRTIVNNWGIIDKIVAVVTDNALNIVNVGESFNNFQIIL
jgi:hypothetical protein